MRRDLTVSTVRKVITMDPGLPVADAVAVDGDRIVEVGSLVRPAGLSSLRGSDADGDGRNWCVPGGRLVVEATYGF